MRTSNDFSKPNTETFFFAFLVATDLCPVFQLSLAQANSDENQNSCEVLSINAPGDEISKVLDLFEESLKSGNQTLFFDLLHPALLRPDAEKSAEFSNMMDSYELKGKSLQRNYIYKLNFAQAPHETNCRKHRVMGVTGPHHQWAIEYSTQTGGDQVRIFILAATVPEALKKKQKNRAMSVGIVHLNTQNWSFGGKTPETLFDTAKKWELLGENIVNWTYLTAGKRIVQGNPYFFDTSYQRQIDEFEKVDVRVKQTLSGYIDKKPDDSSLIIKSFAVVFKEKTPQVGIKVEMTKELAVNDQIQECSRLTKFVTPVFTGSRTILNGVECMLYLPNEPINGIPRSGTIFTRFEDALRSK